MKANRKLGFRLLFLPLLLSQLPQKTFAEVNIKDGSFEKSFTGDVIRHYHSRSLSQGYFGFGWCSELETSLDTSHAGFIDLNDCQFESKIRFTEITKHEFTSPALPKDKIIYKNGTYVRTSSNNSKQSFDSSGKLTSFTNAALKSRILAYDKYGVLAAITDTKGQIFTVKMDNLKQRIIELSAGPKETYKYVYFGQDLLEVKKNNLSLYRYDYDKFHNLLQVSYRNGDREHIRYDSEKDLVIEFDDSSNCQEFYAYRPAQQESKNHFFADAQRLCPKHPIQSVTYEFIYQIHPEGFRYLAKVNIIQKISKTTIQNLTQQFDPVTGLALDPQLRRIANEQK